MPDEVSDKPVVKKNGNHTNYDDLLEKLTAAKGKKVFLATHRCPDPDAMASMMGMAWLLRKLVGVEAEMFYDGEVSHPQNGVMMNVLDVGLKRISEDYKPEHGLHILVDTIPENAGIGKHAEIKFDVVVDHHKDMPQNFNGIMIHRKCGACASIVFDIMKALVPTADWMDKDIDGDVKVATGLLAGIMTDTESMTSDDTTELEFKAFSELFPFRDSDYLKQIVYFKRPKFWVDRKAEACSEAQINEEGIAVVGLGIIPEKQRDLIADMAEEMLSWASVETAITFGIVGGDRIEGSVRSLNPSLTVSDFCKKLGGRHGTGGGKLGKGAYRLPLAGLSLDPDEDEEDVQEAWGSINKRETKRIQRATKK